MEKTKTINEHQKKMYEIEDKRAAKEFIEAFSKVLNLYKNKPSLKILDVGGGSGYFTNELKEYFTGVDCEITLIDTSTYDTWQDKDAKVKYLIVSANELTAHFQPNEFDIIFANRVFHHFVLDSWKNTIVGMHQIMMQIAKVLKKDGHFCVTDHFFNGLVVDNISSRMIFAISSNRQPIIVNLCRKFGVESAGIGVCFLSKKMWLVMLRKSGFQLEELQESYWSKVKGWKKLLFLNKENQLDNILISKLA